MHIGSHIVCRGNIGLLPYHTAIGTEQEIASGYGCGISIVKNTHRAVAGNPQIGKKIKIQAVEFRARQQTDVGRAFSQRIRAQAR